MYNWQQGTVLDIRRCKLAAGPFPKGARKCWWCAGKLKGKRRKWCKDSCSDAYYMNHYFPRSRKAAKRRDKYKCVTCDSKIKLEVNHIVPCLGKHGVQSCSHHLENLEVLCRACHLKVTAQQRADGLFDRGARPKPNRQGRPRRKP